MHTLESSLIIIVKYLQRGPSWSDGGCKTNSKRWGSSATSARSSWNDSGLLGSPGTTWRQLVSIRTWTVQWPLNDTNVDIHHRARCPHRGGCSNQVILNSCISKYLDKEITFSTNLISQWPQPYIAVSAYPVLIISYWYIGNDRYTVEMTLTYVYVHIDVNLTIPGVPRTSAFPPAPRHWLFGPHRLKLPAGCSSILHQRSPLWTKSDTAWTNLHVY